MEESSSKPPRVLRITNPDAIKFLTNINNLPYLNPFMDTELSLSAVAEELNMRLSSLFKKAELMVKFGLLKVGLGQTTSGRSIKLYSSTADIFFLSENLDVVRLLMSQSEARVNQNFEQAILDLYMRRSPQMDSEWGLNVLSKSGVIGIEPAIRPGVRWDFNVSEEPFALIRSKARLSQADAEWFCAELERLNAELQQRYRTDGQLFLTRLCLIRTRDAE